MNGLSGFKIYQKFDVNQRVLPKNYSENLLYIVRGITHTVNEGGWSTNIETIMEIPDDKVLDFNDIEYEKVPLTNTDIQNLTTSTGVNTSYPEFPLTDPPPDSTLLPFEEAVQTLSKVTNDSTARAVFAIMFAEASKTGDAFNSAGGFNYAGVQTDAGVKWSNSEFIIGRFLKEDSQRLREFAIFESNEKFLKFMALRIQAKNIPGNDAALWTQGYIDRWWSPKEKSQYFVGSPTYKDKKNIFLSADRRFNEFLA